MRRGRMARWTAGCGVIGIPVFQGYWGADFLSTTFRRHPDGHMGSIIHQMREIGGRDAVYHGFLRRRSELFQVLAVLLTDGSHHLPLLLPERVPSKRRWPGPPRAIFLGLVVGATARAQLGTAVLDVRVYVCAPPTNLNPLATLPPPIPLGLFDTARFALPGARFALLASRCWCFYCEGETGSGGVWGGFRLGALAFGAFGWLFGFGWGLVA